jgi:hypothetical protein
MLPAGAKPISNGNGSLELPLFPSVLWKGNMGRFETPTLYNDEPSRTCVLVRVDWSTATN